MKIRDGESQMVFDHDEHTATIFDSLNDAQEHLLWATKWDEAGDHLEIQVKP